MSSYPHVTEQDLINLGKIAEQQKSQRVIKNGKKLWKQTLDKTSAESLAAKSKKLKKSRQIYWKIRRSSSKNIPTNYRKHQSSFTKISQSNT